MELDLKGKTAVVLAASKGLGKAAAASLAREGCNVAICSRSNRNLQKTVAHILETSDAEVYSEALDVGNKAALIKFIKNSHKKFGSVDILVSNAGGPPVKSFKETSDEEWHLWYDTTFMSVVRSIKAVLPYMQKNKWGRIINITSVSVKMPVENLIYSNSLRLAVIGLAKTLSVELGKYNITVNNVAPGYHLTDGLERIIVKKVEQGQLREDVLKKFSEGAPLGRIGDPQDLAGLITFLASERASFISGATIQVDGGLTKSTL